MLRIIFLYRFAQQNLLLGLGGNSSSGGPMDLGTTGDLLGRRLGTTATNTSAAQSPGLNLSSHPTTTEDETLSPSFAASSILELKEAISGNNDLNVPDSI
ncbi:hypothetical protein BLOT_009520 [Blomia tropicalis]|nr:hypothetical protein BLOT_009520 [Blomia tropicalis]